MQMYLFNKYLLGVYQVPGNELAGRRKEQTSDKTDIAPVLRDYRKIYQKYWIDSHEVSPVLWKDRGLR